MTKQKPVWRMNKGRGVPSDLGQSVIYFDGLVISVNSDHRAYELVWRNSKRSVLDISAYQTNRAKAAKFERVKCDTCHGYAQIDTYCEYTGDHQFTETCKECNGTGRMARRIAC